SAYELAKSGLSVMVNYHANAEAAATTVERIRELGARASALQADVRQAADCAALVAGTLGEFGRLDVLVVNASIRFRTAPITDLTWADVESKLTGEISAAFHSVQAAFPALAERGGRIVLVSSLMA